MAAAAAATTTNDDYQPAVSKASRTCYINGNANETAAYILNK